MTLKLRTKKFAKVVWFLHSNDNNKQSFATYINTIF